jgi:tetratricopeptide (TPR) repeat protein
MSDIAIIRKDENAENFLSARRPSLALASVPARAQDLLFRMFADPNVLAKAERVELVKKLRECVAQHPKISELRVVFGMALCVNLEVQDAMEELGEAVKLDPNSFIAHLKMGELWMRLLVITKAEDHTQRAARLAQNLAQAESARRQATTIRTMTREGVDRNGYRTPWLALSRVRRLFTRNRGKAEGLATVDAG